MKRWIVAGFLLCGVGFLGSTEDHGKPPDGQPGALPGIVFVGAPMFDEPTDGGIGVYQGSYHWRDGYVYARSATYHRAERTMGPVRPGKNLYALVPATPQGKLTRLTHLKSGAVFKPEPSFDGKKVLFSMRRDGEDWFHLYEIRVDGTELKQLTDGPFNDFAGVYLPDGRIVFCSDRTGYLEEYHEERTETLFVMNGDGTGIQQITFLPGTYFEPSVMRDGRILFSFWDAFHIDVPPFDKHETYLMTVHPDGTEERHLFGSGQYRFFNRERHSGIGLTQAREMPDGRILVQSEMGPSLLDLRAGLSVREALTPIFPGTTSIQVGGTTHRSHLSPLGTRSTAYPLQDGRILYSATQPGARDSAIYVCDPDTREEQQIFNIPNWSEFDAVPVLVERPKPAILPTQAKPAAEGTARFLVVAGRETDNPQRAAALKKARFFRVLEAEYTGVTTSSHTNLETRILGVVPIFPDGSAYFEAPADTPIFLDPIDAAGHRVLMKWNYENTSVAPGTYYPATQMGYMSARPGETRSCFGCHAPQNLAVPNRTVQALKYGPVQITRQSTDLQYRRNDPEAYRRQARLDEVETYRTMLDSKDPILRAWACEMLMYIEDLGKRVAGWAMKANPKICVPIWEPNQRPILTKMVELLKEDAVEVRRAAALALTKLGTADEIPHLKKAQQDADWLVRFYAEAALEVLSGLAEESNNPLNTKGASGWSSVLLEEELKKPVPDLEAIRAVGKRKLAGLVPLLIRFLAQHEQEYHAAEAALALGRVGTPEAIEALWSGLRREVPNKKVHISRYLQHGPRPEEYAILKALLIADAPIGLQDLYLLIALLPNTFMEKPRFEDRMRLESQRVLMPRLMMERAGFRRRAVQILLLALEKNQQSNDPLYQQILKGINLERPFSEHGRPFPVVKEIGPEEALWLLTCLLKPEVDFETPEKHQELEDRLIPFLTSAHQRERVEAAVLLGIIGFGKKAASALAAEIAKPYPFPEISSIGKGMPDPNERDKAYMVLALAKHIEKVEDLKPFADPKKMFRDIRYGLTRGLAMRGREDTIPLLIDLATRDPITLIRQQARYAIADIQDACRLAEKPVPNVQLPEPSPLEAHYPPRGLTWTDTTFQDLPGVHPLAFPYPVRPANFLDAKDFHNLNMAQATGAKFMMIRHVAEMQNVFEVAIKTSNPKELTKNMVKALETRYPHIHYQAAKALADHGDRSAIPALLSQLDASIKVQDLVGFWWCCEALGKFQAKEAMPLLTKYAVEKNPAQTYGPEGMATGYIAARTLARIAGDEKNPEVQRCLKSDNVWLRAGALRGLAEAKAPGIEAMLRQASTEDNPALVRQEARVQLARFKKGG